MSEVQKISIRFFDDREVRAVWDEARAKWWFSVLDIIGVLNAQDDYAKNRNYWKYLKTKLRNEGNEVVRSTNQLKLLAPDGKRRLTDVLDNAGVYVEMNVAHPFREGNGRATRIWLDLMLKKNLQLCIDWSQVDKRKYLEAMTRSVADPTCIKDLLRSAITDKINDRDTFMKGIDYSYYYEQED